MSEKYPKLLIQFVGVPGSGKTYFSEHLADKIGAVHLNSHAVKLAIFGSEDNVETAINTQGIAAVDAMAFGAMSYCTARLLGVGRPVIYDGAVNKRSERKKLRDVAESAGGKSVVMIMKIPQDLAIKRAAERRGDDNHLGFDSSNHAREVVERIAHDIEPPADDELVVEIDGEADFEQQYESFRRQLSETTFS